MTTVEDEVVLLTIRVRRDTSFPSGQFISIRRYTIGHSSEPDRSAEVGTINHAVELTREWLEDAPSLP